MFFLFLFLCTAGLAAAAAALQWFRFGWKGGELLLPLFSFLFFFLHNVACSSSYVFSVGLDLGGEESCCCCCCFFLLFFFAR